MRRLITGEASLIMLLTTISLLIIAFILKVVFTSWEIAHILIPLYFLAPLFAVQFSKLLKVASEPIVLTPAVYRLLLVLLLLPLGLSVVGRNVLSAGVCFVHNATPIRNLHDVVPGEQLVLCGYVQGCVGSARVGREQHMWEICLFSDPVESQATVLLYNTDLTLNANNVFDFSSLTAFREGALLVSDVWVWRSLERGDCLETEILFCEVGYPDPPVAEVSFFQNSIWDDAP